MTTFTHETAEPNNEDFQQYLSDNGIWSLRGDLERNGFYEYSFMAPRDTIMYFISEFFDYTMEEAAELGCLS